MTTRAIHKLSDTKVKAFTQPGRLHDGGNLYFAVTERGARSWEFRYEHLTIKGKRKTMGLGGYPNVSLSKARELHKEAAALVRDGIDPIDARKANRQTAATSLTVKQACEAYLVAQRAKWKTERHVGQMEQRLCSFVFPVIGHLPISDIKGAEARQVLVPIWTEKNATAGRVRQYMEDTVNWAIHEGVRTDESNPFEVKRLQFALPFGIRKTEHFASLPYDQASTFLTELRAQPDSVKKFALEFVMLCAVRVADICGGGKDHSEPMKWSHVDLNSKLWTIPDTKMGKSLAVPLSDAAMAVLGQMQRYRDPENDVVFPGAVRGTVIADSTLRYLIADMGYKGLATTHGMRSTFRTWAAEVTNFDKPVIEMALAHAQSELDQAYMRGALLDKRRRLMAAWADYLGGNAVQAGGTVVALRA